MASTADERDLEEAINYLVKQFPSRPDWQEIIIRECKRFSLSWRSELRVNDRPHEYRTPEIRVSVPGTSQDVFNKMLTDGTFSAPAMTHTPVYTGKIEELLPPGNPVIRLVDSARMIIYNVTLPQHVFFPGLIQDEVKGEADGVYVVVSGKGKGNLAWFNERFGRALFTGILERFKSALSRAAAQAAPSGQTFPTRDPATLLPPDFSARF